MDQDWQEHLGYWRTSTPKFTCEVWPAEPGYRWVVYRLTGEYMYAGTGRTVDIAKREALDILR